MSVTTTAITAPGQQALFNYDEIEEIHRKPIEQAEQRINVLFTRNAVNYIKVGKELQENRYRFPTIDIFGAWFKEKFNGSLRTAYSLINAYKKFGDVDEATIGNIGLSVLYELAADSTPNAARESVLQIASSGQPVSTEVAKEIIEQTKQAEKEAQADLFIETDETTATEVIEAEQLPALVLCLCGHTQDRHAEEVSNCQDCNCECYEVEKVTRENVETLAEITETTTTTTVVAAPPVAPLPEVAVPMQGQADILYDAATSQLVITIYPKKGDDRDCLLSTKANNDQPTFEMIKHSQIADVFANFTLNKQLLALKTALFEQNEAKKNAPKSAPKSATSTKTKTTTKTAVKKGKK